jgi:peptide/nickel transport system permease protein
MGGSTPELQKETSDDVVDRTYFDIVSSQFKANRLAVVGLWIVAILILIAIFAPFLANDKPLVFHGYRYRLYTKTYDQLVYAHADIAGVGQKGSPVVIPGLYEDGIVLTGIGETYAKEIASWDAQNPTWKQVRDVSFGDEANTLLNRVRVRLEDSITDLDKDNQWARGARDMNWLRKQKLPKDVEGDLDTLIALARKNLDAAYRAKTERRKKALLQQFRQMRGEVSKEDQRAIKSFAKRYEKTITADLHKADPATLKQFDGLIVEVRERLSPKTVHFVEHTDFPALRQLTGLDIFFMLLVVLMATHMWWGRLVPFATQQQLLTRKAASLFLVPMLASLLWWAVVPAFNDTTDYAQGMQDGSLSCSFRLMAPLRYGVNQNDTDINNLPPWWDPFGGDTAEKRVQAKKSKESKKKPSTGDSALDLQLTVLQERLDALEKLETKHQSGYHSFLDFLNRHHMGTDGTGRDLTTRMIWGSRISLSIGFVAVGIYVVIGVILGALAGYFGGWIDIVLSRVIEIVICFPVFFLILTVIAFIGPSIFNIMLVLGVTRWTGVARLVRGEFLRLRAKDFVVAGKALGFSDARVIFRHILPNALAPVLVAATFGVASAILIESSLSFLGFGVKVPTPTWGSVLSTARETWIHWWVTLFPGMAIFLTVTMYNLVGEGIRDAVDPRMRQ